MAKRTPAGTDAQRVRAQNDASAQQNQGAATEFNAEFGAETNAAEVRKKNQKSQANKQG